MEGEKRRENILSCLLYTSELSSGEKSLVKDLRKAFVESRVLREHIDFLYAKGSLYKVFNNNLLYHGCIPLDEKGDFDTIFLEGKEFSGKSYMDYADKMARKAFYSKKDMNCLLYTSLLRQNLLRRHLQSLLQRHLTIIRIMQENNYLGK